MKPRLPLTIATIAALALSLPAAADKQYVQQQQPNPQKSSQEDAAKKQQTSKHNKRIAQVTGRLTAAKTFQLKGQEHKHVLGRIQTPSGKTVIADLGTVQDVRNAKLRRGQQVTVVGPAGRVNGKPVIVADKLRADQGPTLTIIRIIPIEDARAKAMQAAGRMGTSDSSPNQFDGQSANRPDRPQPGATQQPTLRLVSGRITQTLEARLKGLDQKHLLAILQTRDNKNVLVDLGPKEKLTDINLKKGEYIAAFGPVGRINGQPAIFAEQAADIVNIDRSEMRSQVRTAASRQGPATQPAKRQGKPSTQPKAPNPQSRQRSANQQRG